MNQIHFIRNASLVLQLNGKRILIDPVFGDKSTSEPIPFSNGIKNPTSHIKGNIKDYLIGIDAILITHFHEDHFDQAAINYLNKNTKLYCQNEDEEKIKKLGFTNVCTLEKEIDFGDINIQRFAASHYHGDNQSEPFGTSSSYLFTGDGKKIFFTGDAVLDDKLKYSLNYSQPDIIFANGGDCQFSQQNPILDPGKNMTLTNKEIVEIASLYKNTKIYTIHLDAINHATVTRKEFLEYINSKNKNLLNRVFAPENGDIIIL